MAERNLSEFHTLHIITHNYIDAINKYYAAGVAYKYSDTALC